MKLVVNVSNRFFKQSLAQFLRQAKQLKWIKGEIYMGEMSLYAPLIGRRHQPLLRALHWIICCLLRQDFIDMLSGVTEEPFLLKSEIYLSFEGPYLDKHYLHLSYIDCMLHWGLSFFFPESSSYLWTVSIFQRWSRVKGLTLKFKERAHSTLVLHPLCF